MDVFVCEFYKYVYFAIVHPICYKHDIVVTLNSIEKCYVFIEFEMCMI